MRKKTFFLAAFAIASCGSYPSVTERIVDVTDDVQGRLLAPEQKDDLPLAYCAKNLCYTYSEADIEKIKKYIASLEVRLRKCQKPRLENVE